MEEVYVFSFWKVGFMIFVVYVRILQSTLLIIEKRRQKKNLTDTYVRTYECVGEQMHIRAHTETHHVYWNSQKQRNIT